MKAFLKRYWFTLVVLVLLVIDVVSAFYSVGEVVTQKGAIGTVLTYVFYAMCGYYIRKDVKHG